MFKEVTIGQLQSLARGVDHSLLIAITLNTGEEILVQLKETSLQSKLIERVSKECVF